MMQPVLWPNTLEVTMDWDRKARRGAAATDKLNYTSMLWTCPTQFMIVDELPFNFGESPNYEYFNRVALQPQYIRCDEYGLRKKVISLDTPTRWSSTYKLLNDAIAYRDVLTNMYNESRTDGRFITNGHWSLAKIIHDALETFDNATHIFSYVYEPNIHMVIIECIKIICTIKQTSHANPDPYVKNLLNNMKVNWCDYFTEFPPIYAIAVILDPCIKLEERLCEDYGVVIQPQPVGSSMGTSRFEILEP
ncbi:Zinc finger BED domain-containing protein RICESLEEPER 2, partial [Bienertia sinuspersici]